MGYTHINLTSQERTHENDDDVIVVLSFCNAKIMISLKKQNKFRNFYTKITYPQGSGAFRFPATL